MASPLSLPAVLNPPLTGREAVMDALYRSAIAWDTNDAALFESAFMPTGVFDVNGRVMQGVSEIHARAHSIIFKLDTTHSISNLRVHIGAGTQTTGDTGGKGGEETEASLTATVIAQHFAEGKGMELGQLNLMSGALYSGELVKDADGLWKFTHLRVKPIWAVGDYSVVGGGFEETEQ